MMTGAARPRAAATDSVGWVVLDPPLRPVTHGGSSTIHQTESASVKTRKGVPNMGGERKPPGSDGAGVLVFLHGFYTFVTIEATGACAWPSWADTEFYAETMKTVAAIGKAENEAEIAKKGKLTDKEKAALRAKISPQL